MQMKVIPQDNIVQNFLWYVSSVFALIYMTKRIYMRLTLCAESVEKQFFDKILHFCETNANEIETVW